VEVHSKKENEYKVGKGDNLGPVNQILALLTKRNTKATFFENERFIKMYKLYKFRIINTTFCI